MKIRTVYFKVHDMQQAVAFWQEFLEIKPHKQFDEWHEFMVGNLRLGLLKDLEGDAHSGCNCVPVFEFPDDEVLMYCTRAIQLGALLIVDGLNDPNLRSMVLRDPCGNEFEVSKFHDQ